jgi:cellulose biosynthesis protein BcsQ
VSVFGKFDINPLKLKDILALIKKNYDYILIDSSPALNDETLGAMIASDEILLLQLQYSDTIHNNESVTIAKRRGIKVQGLF